MRHLILLLLAACAAAQTPRGHYAFERKSTLSTSTEAITLQMPAASLGRYVEMKRCSVYSSVELEITIERNGTLATSTELTPSATNTASATAAAKVYRSSNVGEGTTFGRAVVPAGIHLPLDMTDVTIGPGENVTIRTASTSGTVIIGCKYQER